MTDDPQQPTAHLLLELFENRIANFTQSFLEIQSDLLPETSLD